LVLSGQSCSTVQCSFADEICSNISKIKIK